MIYIKAQYSMEFILIFAFSLAIILPLVSIMNSQYAENKGELDESQARQVLEDISLRVHETYYAGYPSRTTLDLYFPPNILIINSTIVSTGTGDKSELLFLFGIGQTESSIVHIFPFHVNATLRPGQGRRRILIKAEKDALGNGYVNITDYR